MSATAKIDRSDLETKVKEGEAVLDLGSGSGMDTFIAALKVGRSGSVVGLDVTDEQRAKAQRLCEDAGLANVTYVKGYIEEIPLDDRRFDAVISNGVINLSADKPAIFRDAARVLKSGGRLALSDIVTAIPLPEGVVCNATLWAACIGGRAATGRLPRRDRTGGVYGRARTRQPAISISLADAHGAANKYGVKSISLVATRR